MDKCGCQDLSAISGRAEADGRLSVTLGSVGTAIGVNTCPIIH